MRLERTARAEQDLIEIWNYIAQDNRRAADRMFDLLVQKSRLLAHNPNIGRSREEIGAGVRSTVAGSYLVLYRVHSDRVEFLRYLHQRRNLSNIV
jgi:toxin ParE1/3/4